MIKRTSTRFNQIVGKVDLYKILSTNLVQRGFGPRSGYLFSDIEAVSYGRKEVELNRAGLLSADSLVKRFQNILIQPTTPAYHVIKICQALIDLPEEQQEEKILLVDLANFDSNGKNTQIAALQAMITHLTGLKGLYITVPEGRQSQRLLATAGILAQAFVNNNEVTSVCCKKHSRPLKRKVQIALGANVHKDLFKEKVNFSDSHSCQHARLSDTTVYSTNSFVHLNVPEEILDQVCYYSTFHSARVFEDLPIMEDSSIRSEKSLLGKYDLFNKNKMRKLRNWVKKPVLNVSYLKRALPPRTRSVGFVIRCSQIDMLLNVIQGVIFARRL